MKLTNKSLYLEKQTVSSLDLKIETLVNAKIKATHNKANAGAGKCSSSGNCMAYA
ncbi:MAG: hypothetical protein Q4D76_17950 [Oscillospiraceae bacterium]|nr:hypothetical protein [Oscillospiraceae bacterium]